MKKFNFCNAVFAVFLIVLSVFTFVIPSPAQEKKAKPLVLVELFTSLNCLNCPAAERALTFLEDQQPYPEAEIITLAFHVDYLNNANWKDEFASQLFTQRQQIYGQKLFQGTIYTPQMIVDGATQFMGSDLRKARAAVISAARNRKADILLERETMDKLNLNKLNIEVSNMPAHADATAYLAIVEDGVSPINKRYGQTDIPSEYNAVVKFLQPLGKISANQMSYKNAFDVKSSNVQDSNKTSLIVFIQENQSRAIIGCNRIKYFDLNLEK